MTKRGFGELELSILSLLKAGDRLTVKQVQAHLGGLDNYNTIMTVMSRLAEKGKLARERVGLQYEYWMASDQPVTASFIQQLKKKLFNVPTSEMVSYLIESADDISNEELSELEELIRMAKKNRGKI